MNTKILSLILTIFTLSSCKTILISEKKVPTEKICGAQAKYECKATGFGSNKLTVRIFKKERPNPAGKGIFAGLGRSADINPEIFHNTYKNIELDSSEVTIEKTKIEYDLKKDNVTKILVDLNAELKEEKVNSEARLQIKNDFEKQLNSFLKIEAYIETYTLNDSIPDKIRDVKNGTETEKRYVDAYNLLKKSNRPLIRQVIVIREICEFKENKNIRNILEPILTAKIGEGDAKANAILSGILKRDKTENFSTNYDKTTIYSYGYFSDNWMYK